MKMETENYSDNENFTDSQLVFHVRNALASVKSGDIDSYNQLVGVMHHHQRLTMDEVALLETSLKALAGTVTCLDVAYHESLLSAIFGMNMWVYRPNVMDALIDLIISLAVSSGKYLDACLDMLINNFMPPYHYLDKLTEPRFVSKKHEVLSRLHEALQKISDFVPLAPLRLFPIVSQRMPTIHSTNNLIVIYMENMLKLARSEIGKVVGRDIVSSVMERLRDLDVEIGWDGDLQEDSGKGVFEIELEDVDDETEHAEQDGDEYPMGSISRKGLTGNMIAELLDNLMVLTFEHIESCVGSGHTVELYETLLWSFQDHVLNTYKSKFSQFVMFYLCALDPENSGVKFATELADIFCKGNHPPLTRMSAVAYLASYLSRGRFLSPSFIASILNRLVSWCLQYSKTRDGNINPKAHQVFYSGCQAIMYVLCFRMRYIMDVPRLKTQLSLMPLEPILKHKLEPLEVCLPSVVQEFLRQAKTGGLLTVSDTFIFDDLLDSELSRTYGGSERLDMFFPYDPCLLKKCDSYIRPNFVYWSMVRTSYENGEDSNDEGGSNSDDDGAEVYVNENDDTFMEDDIAKSIDDNDLDHALNKMSITPKNSLKSRFGTTRMPSRIRPSMSPESM